VAVIGPLGSGTTSTARRLADRLGVACVELDALFRQPERSSASTLAFRRAVSAALAAAEDRYDGWVTAGNHLMVADLVHGPADAIVWLDVPRRRTMVRVLWSGLGRIARRTTSADGTPERLRTLVHPRRGSVAGAWRTHRGLRRRYEELADTPLWSSTRVIRVTRPIDVDLLADELCD